MNLVLVFIVVGVSITLEIEAQSNFDRNYVGVAFSPYVDPQPSRNWNEYSVEDIKKMLKVINTKFSHISTYSMGVQKWCQSSSWEKCDSNALVARAAAQLNKESSSGFKVNIGVFQTTEYQQKEIDNAFAAAADANKISQGTVWGITFTNEYIVDVDTGRKVLEMIRQSKSKASQQKLKLGTRINKCENINDQNDFGRVLKDIVKESDFIYCNVYPTKENVRLGATRSAELVGNSVNGLIRDFKKVNSKIDFRIGETGWPSAENSFNDSENNIRNLVDYWRGINNWAKSNKVQTQMFEAIDEPWKGRESQWKGESHYGWWYKPNSKENIYVEKETNQQFS